MPTYTFSKEEASEIRYRVFVRLGEISSSYNSERARFKTELAILLSIQAKIDKSLAERS
jgi:hypothetical protein